MKILLLLCSLFIWVKTTQASVLTFDDIAPSPIFAQIPNGYGGFDWSNMYYQNTTYISVMPSGYPNAVLSGDYVAFNGSGNIATISSINDFTFNGAYFTAGFSDGLTIKLQAFKNTLQIYSKDIIVDTKTAKYFDFGFVDIDTLIFSAFGGIDFEFPTYQPRTVFAMDNFTVNQVPLPGAFWVMCIGLYGLFKIRRNTLTN